MSKNKDPLMQYIKVNRQYDPKVLSVTYGMSLDAAKRAIKKVQEEEKEIQIAKEKIDNHLQEVDGSLCIVLPDEYDLDLMNKKIANKLQLIVGQDARKRIKKFEQIHDLLKNRTFLEASINQIALQFNLSATTISDYFQRKGFKRHWHTVKNIPPFPEQSKVLATLSAYPFASYQEVADICGLSYDQAHAYFVLLKEETIKKNMSIPNLKLELRRVVTQDKYITPKQLAEAYGLRSSFLVQLLLRTEEKIYGYCTKYIV
jgi:AraC-like DNA-binding protein